MKSILQERKECYFTKCTTGLHEHHIFFGTGQREISEQNGFKVWLRGDLHNRCRCGGGAEKPGAGAGTDG